MVFRLHGMTATLQDAMRYLRNAGGGKVDSLLWADSGQIHLAAVLLAIDLIPDTMLMQRQVLLDAISGCASFQGNHIHVYLKITWHKGLDNWTMKAIFAFLIPVGVLSESDSLQLPSKVQSRY